MIRGSPRPASLWLCASASIVLTLIGLHYLREWQIDRFIGVFVLQLGVYGYAAWRMLRAAASSASQERHALIVILIAAAVLRGIALFAPQALSTDAFRYVWDGRVQSAGINPYRYVPADPALTALRDTAIYPNINRATYAHTIYPPTAQIAFLAIDRVNDGMLGMKLAMAAFDGVSIVCLLALLRLHGLPTTRVLLYAWHPLPVWEFAGTGHVDAIAIALLLLAFLSASRRAPFLTGVALAAATLVKFYPAIAAPVLYRRWDWRMPLAFVLTLVALYLPYMSVGSGVFGFLSGYANEEGLRNGRGIYLWSVLERWFHVPPAVAHYYPVLAASLLAGAALWSQFRGRMRAPGEVAAALGLAGLFTLMVSPHDPWYFTFLVPFLCFRFTAAHCWLTGACTLMYVMPDPTGLEAQSLLYLPFLALLALHHAYPHHQPTSPEILHANRAPTHSTP